MHIQDMGNDENILEKFGRNLNEEVKKGKMDPIIGRDDEIRSAIMILSRKNAEMRFSVRRYRQRQLAATDQD